MMNSTANLTEPADQVDMEYYQYKSVSSGSIVAMAFAILSVGSVFFFSLLFLPVIGVMFAIFSMLKIQRFSDELTGLGIARTALALNTILFFGVITLNSYIYLTEVPDGYQRISFQDLQPAKGSRRPVPQSAIDLNGKKVFIKGYTYPGEKRINLKTFVLVPDMQTCCFGGQPKLTDMIEVTLNDPLRAEYSWNYRKLTGTLVVDEKIKPVTGLGGVYYRLKADSIR